MKINKGIKNIIYSRKATKFYRRGYPLVLPRTVWIAVTYKCNSRCKMCGIWKRYVKNPELVKKEMTLQEFKTFIDKNNFLRDISLSGGEPFLRSDLKEMFLYLDKKGYPTGTATNGVMKEHIIRVEEEIINSPSRKNPHGLEVSVDGLYEEHDRVRGVKGLFDRVVGIIKWGIEAQNRYPFFSISLSHTITSNNYGRLLELIDYFIQLGLKPKQISFRTAQTSSTFYGKVDLDEIPKENEKVIVEIERVMEKHSYYRKDWFYRNMINYLRNPSGFRIPCYAGISFAYIDAYWDVYPCITWSEPIGNLRESEFSLQDIWTSEKAEKIRRLIKQGNCPNCWTGCSTIPSRVSNTKLLIKHYAGLR